MELEVLAKRVATALLDKGYTMATAEECTCGLIGASIASQDYAQRWYKGTVVTYTFEEAIKVLEVPQYVIMRNDFVSLQVASQMAMSVREKFNTNMAVSIVGYVDGYGSSDVAAGDIQICSLKMINDKLDFKYKKVMVKGNNRAKNIQTALEEALLLVLEHILED